MHKLLFRARLTHLSRQHLAVPFTPRWNSTSSAPDLVVRLHADLKTALKSKDAFSATTIRSVLSEVYAAQKQPVSPALKTSDIISIIRKAQLRRLESMKQFETASRHDLAQHEKKEATLLASYLPARLSIDEVDKVMREIITNVTEKDNVKKAKGLVLKTFYTQVDKNTVDGELVRQRLDNLWTL